VLQEGGVSKVSCDLRRICTSDATEKRFMDLFRAVHPSSRSCPSGYQAVD